MYPSLYSSLLTRGPSHPGYREHYHTHAFQASQWAESGTMLGGLEILRHFLFSIGTSPFVSDKQHANLAHHAASSMFENGNRACRRDIPFGVGDRRKEITRGNTPRNGNIVLGPNKTLGFKRTKSETSGWKSILMTRGQSTPMEYGSKRSSLVRGVRGV